MTKSKIDKNVTRDLLELSKSLLEKKINKKKPVVKKKKPTKPKKPKKPKKKIKKGGADGNISSNNTYIDDNINKIGILDPDGKYLNPLTMESYKNVYKDDPDRGNTYAGYAKAWSELPAYTYGAQKIIDVIKNNQVSMIVAGTGSGKTVLVPKYALHALNYNGRVISTNPKRLPTISNAKYAARCLDVKIGEQVGYVVKGEKKKTKDTKLIFATDGWLAAKLTGDDPLLLKEGIDCVIIDEVHERKINIDILLLLLKGVCMKRPEFKLLIVSATVDVSIFRNYYAKQFKFGELDLPGEPNYPITAHFLETPVKDYMKKGVETIVDILKKNEDHEIIFFLTSPSDCAKACGMLESKMRIERQKGLNVKEFCIVVASGMKPQDEELATSNSKYKTYAEDGFDGNYNRKIIMATNAVESSLTVPNLKFVVDSGYEKHPGYNPETMSETLFAQFITEAQAKQRKGRCGRLFPGEWYPLYTKKQYESFNKFPISEILKSDLTETILNFFSMTGIDTVIDVIELLNSLIEIPSKEYVQSAFHTLIALGAIEIIQKGGSYSSQPLDIDDFKNGKLTETGHEMDRFRNTSPNIKKILASANDVSKEIGFDISKHICDLGAIYMALDGDMNKLFTGFKCSMKMPSSNNKKKMSEFRKLEERQRQHYNNQIKKISSSYGDFFTMYKVFQLYKKLKYEMEEKGDTRLLDDFARKYFIKKSGWMYFKNAVRLSRQWVRAMKGNSEFHINPDDFLNVQKDPERINSDEINRDLNENQNGGSSQDKDMFEGVFMCLSRGYIDKLAKKTDGKKYKTCFPPKLTTNKINRSSTINLYKKDFKYYIYGKLKESDFGTELSTINGIPEKYIMMLPQTTKDYILRCIEDKKEKFEFNYKNH